MVGVAPGQKTEWYQLKLQKLVNVISQLCQKRETWKHISIALLHVCGQEFLNLHRTTLWRIRVATRLVLFVFFVHVFIILGQKYYICHLFMAVYHGDAYQFTA